MSRQYYKYANREGDLSKLSGRLIVVEGPDGSGRSTQVKLLTQWFEDMGYFVENTGLKRSRLVADELTEAQEGNILSKTTMGLFYATDFADQLENTIIPSLRAGAIVICDRYIYTLMARDMVRGAGMDWVSDLYGFALVPDAVFYLKVDADLLMARNFEKRAVLDYWESGMDIGLSWDSYDSFVQYQDRLNQAFLTLQSNYKFLVVDGNQSPNKVFSELKAPIERMLNE